MTIRINGQELPPEAIRYELERLLRFYAEHLSAEQLRAQMDALKTKATEQAIGARLLIGEANRLDIKAPEGDVDDRVNTMIENAGGQENFAQLLEQQNLTEEMLRRSIEQGRRVDMLVDKITEGTPEPTEEEMSEHFEAHSQEYATPPRAQAQHILVRSEDNDDDRNAAKTRLSEIKERIEEGADFASEAAAHSECPSGKKTGGSLGWFSRGMMVPEFDEAVFSMSVGALSELIETSFGYHLIHKTGHEDGGEAAFDEVRDKVREFLRHARRGEMIAAYVAELKAKAVIEEE